MSFSLEIQRESRGAGRREGEGQDPKEGSQAIVSSSSPRWHSDCRAQKPSPRLQGWDAAAQLSKPPAAAAPCPGPAPSQVYLITSELGGGSRPGSTAWVIYFKIIGIKISRAEIYVQGEAQEARESPSPLVPGSFISSPHPQFLCSFHYDFKS